MSVARIGIHILPAAITAQGVQNTENPGQDKISLNSHRVVTTLISNTIC